MVGTPTRDGTPPLAGGLDARLIVLKAVSDATRLQVLDTLVHRGPHCHCELEEELAVPANRLSFHLRILRDAGLVRTRRRGRRVEYHVDASGLGALRDAVPNDPHPPTIGHHDSREAGP
jgi:ArsR family transcriptional regulator, arsenate/arsenite/antimonite-responsive transcriptional repressor